MGQLPLDDPLGFWGMHKARRSGCARDTKHSTQCNQRTGTGGGMQGVHRAAKGGLASQGIARLGTDFKRRSGGSHGAVEGAMAGGILQQTPIDGCALRGAGYLTP